jgi:hypothetical protein
VVVASVVVVVVVVVLVDVTVTVEDEVEVFPKTGTPYIVSTKATIIPTAPPFVITLPKCHLTI